jgi:hypothetical protein
MFEKETGLKARGKITRSPQISPDPVLMRDPHEGARLVRAFLKIADPRLRSAIVQMIENMEPTAVRS